MKNLMTTDAQKKIIENREALATTRHLLLNGFLDNYDGELERYMQEVLTALVTNTARIRQSQQETFDKHPTFAATCIRV